MGTHFERGFLLFSGTISVCMRTKYVVLFFLLSLGWSFLLLVVSLFAVIFYIDTAKEDRITNQIFGYSRITHYPCTKFSTITKQCRFLDHSWESWHNSVAPQSGKNEVQIAKGKLACFGCLRNRSISTPTSDCLGRFEAWAWLLCSWCC